MVVQRLRCPIVQPPSLARWYLLQRYFDLVTTRCNVEDAAAWIPWTGWRGWSVDAACQWPIRRSDTWNVMHNTQPQPNQQHGSFGIDLDSFAREMIAAFLIGRYFHVCFHAHFAPAGGVSMEPAGWVLLWPWIVAWFFQQSTVFSAWYKLWRAARQDMPGRRKFFLTAMTM